MARRGSLIFQYRDDGNSTAFRQTIFSSVLGILLFLGFLAAAVYNHNFSLLFGIGIVLGLDFLFEWVFIVFYKKDAIHDKQEVIESGSLWTMNKEYRVIK